MAETTSLESQLIRGAGAAVSKDPYGRVLAAQERASKQLTEGIKGIGTAFAAKKKERDDKIEKQTKQNDADWNKIQQEFIDDNGLSIEAWGKARDLADEMKVEHDACQTGQEGNRCRQAMRIKLKSMVGKWANARDVVQANIDISKNPNLEQSAYDKQSEAGRENGKILGGISGRNMDSRMKNDGEIAELETRLEGLQAKGPAAMEEEFIKDERVKLQKKIKNLKETNDIEVGWKIEDEFISADDDRLSNLQTHVANDVKLHVTKRDEEQKEKYDKYKDGASGGEPYNKDKSIAANKSAITPKNITSIYYDDVLGQGQALIKNLEEHPVFNGMTYSGLGIEQVGEDDIIDVDERDEISTEDKQSMINVLADPNYLDGKFYNYERSRDAAAEAMAEGDLRRYNKHMYGDDFYKLTQEQRTARINKLSNPTPGQVEKGFRKGGGIIGAQEHADSVWNAVTGSWDPKTSDFNPNTY